MSENAAWRGMSEAEAAARLKAEGFNELPRAPRHNPARIALEVCTEPMLQLLSLATAIYFVLGNFGEGLILGGSALVTVVIAVVQETRTEHVLESLRDLTSPRAQVIRDGILRRIAGREVVRGDVIILAEGDRVPADALLLSSHDLQVDESLLTGESVPVTKVAAELPTAWPRPGGDGLPVVFSATMIVRGQGIGEVRAVGASSEIGKIGRALSEIKDEPTALHAQTRRLVRTLAVVGIALSLLTAILYGVLRGSWLDGFLAGITLAMSILPEEFPLVLTIFLVMGAWRISKARVLTRRSAAIEALGAATVLCTDKTGTLTLNRMSVAELWTAGGGLRLDEGPTPQFPEPFRLLSEFGMLACEIDPSDPMEQAIHALRSLSPALGDRLHPDWVLAREYALSSQLFAMSHVWQPSGATQYVVAAKGAPEAIAAMSHLIGSTLDKIHEAADRMASRGRRVLGVARAQFQGSQWPDSQKDFAFEFLGLIGLADPLRPTVRPMIRECRAAGIRVVMVTGDYPVTARAIAEQAGITASGDIITGDALAVLSDAELRERVRTTAVFARIAPEQKLRIVEAYKANGEIVAMTGDGVNDAPSLRAANIGIAMGGRGTDVAREAAAIVLLDDDLGSVVAAVRLGRRIYDNLRKAMGYLLAVHVPIAGLALLPLVLGWPLIFSPVHIAFLELVIDPLSSIAFESEVEEADVMRRPPRDSTRPLFSRGFVGWSLFEGFWVFILTTAIFATVHHLGMPDSDERGLVFASLVMGEFGLIFVNRSFSSSLFAALTRPNTPLWLILTATASLLVTIFAVPPVREVFQFGPLHRGDLLVIAGTGAATILILEAMKKLRLARQE